jgi:hypothetical protein
MQAEPLVALAATGAGETTSGLPDGNVRGLASEARFALAPIWMPSSGCQRENCPASD